MYRGSFVRSLSGLADGMFAASYCSLLYAQRRCIKIHEIPTVGNKPSKRVGEESDCCPITSSPQVYCRTALCYSAGK